MSALDGKLEPETKNGYSCPTDAAVVSIAISLKRIADALTPQDGASSCEIVQQISEMLAAQPRAPFGNRQREEWGPRP